MEFILIGLFVLLWAWGHRVREDIRRRHPPRPRRRNGPRPADPIGLVTLARLSRDAGYASRPA